MPNLLVLHTKPCSSFSCPSFKNVSSVFCLFSYEKSVGLLSLLLFWLVCSGHNNYLLCKTINCFMCECFYQTTDSLYITLKIFQGALTPYEVAVVISPNRTVCLLGYVL